MPIDRALIILICKAASVICCGQVYCKVQCLSMAHHQNGPSNTPSTLASYPASEGRLPVILHYARRTSTVSSCAVCEQERRLAILSSHLSLYYAPSFLSRVAWNGPSPRASRENILIVRTLRAKGTVLAAIPFPCVQASFPFSLPSQGGLFGLPLRASNEGLLRPRVARAQETKRLPCRALDCPFHRLL